MSINVPEAPRRWLFEERRKPLITQRGLEKRFGWPSGSIAAIEDGRIRLEESQWAELFEVLNEIAQAIQQASEVREEVSV